jgi:hypothetical protein
VTDRRPGRITPMYLAHHYPDQYERCVLVGQAHVCRRCLVLYPLAIATLVLVVLAPVPDALQNLVWVLGPLPAVGELLAEQFGRITYRPRRQIAVTIPLAVALGCGFGLYLDDHTSVLFWGIVVLYTGVCAGAVLWARRGSDARSSV